jgi:hypothetical protein
MNGCEYVGIAMESRLVFQMYMVRISIGLPALLTEVFRNSNWFLHVECKESNLQRDHTSFIHILAYSSLMIIFLSH